MLYKIKNPCYFLILLPLYPRGTTVTGSFQEPGSSFEKTEYAKRFFLVPTLKMEKLCLNLYQGAYRSQRVNIFESSEYEKIDIF